MCLCERLPFVNEPLLFCNKNGKSGRTCYFFPDVPSKMMLGGTFCTRY